tara:strand:+ start:964 stop:1506 length:543 start_codon:yes stop_codon:yes gene_type:complete
MKEEAINPETQKEITSPEIEAGPISQLLKKQDLKHKVLSQDHLGIEIIEVEPTLLFKIVTELKLNGFNYLQCQGGYDEGAGKRLVCFYHLISMDDLDDGFQTKEVRLKVFLNRDGELTVPSLYKIFRGSDWQERETYDMFGIKFEGHPHPKRLLMPEDWKGWPLRKDYVQPDFYEMQDAY